MYDFKESDLEDLGQIGHGEFGSVHKVLHKPSNTHMALKRIGPTVGNQRERKKVLKELDFVLECHEYEYVVRFYGVKFNNEPVMGFEIYLDLSWNSFGWNDWWINLFITLE